jgi:thioredoxin
LVDAPENISLVSGPLLQNRLEENLGMGAAAEVDNDSFDQEVLKPEVPVLVDFWAPWCGPCRAMHPAIDALARDFKVCKVNVDSNPRLAERYDVSSIPALMVFQNGKIVARHLGVTPEATLRAELQRLQPA